MGFKQAFLFHLADPGDTANLGYNELWYNEIRLIKSIFEVIPDRGSKPTVSISTAFKGKDNRIINKGGNDRSLYTLWSHKNTMICV